MQSSESFQWGDGHLLPTRAVVKYQRRKIYVGGEKYSTCNGKLLSISIIFKTSLDKTLGFYLSINLFLYLETVV